MGMERACQLLNLPIEEHYLIVNVVIQILIQILNRILLDFFHFNIFEGTALPTSISTLYNPTTGNV